MTRRIISADALLLRYALANMGGVIGYLPLLTLLLPIKIAAIAPDARIDLVTLATLVGAVAASVSNIAFGWWSDRSVARGGGRRRFIGAGVAATALSYALIAAADGPVAIVLAVAAFQIALNAQLAPFFAGMAEAVPDDRKGLAGGLLALGNPAASALSALVIGILVGEAARFAVVASAMIACTLPFLLVRDRAPAANDTAAPPRPLPPRRDLIVAWVARLLVQVAGVALFHYQFYYFQSIAPDASGTALASRLGRLMTIAYLVPFPIAILAGRLSDRIGRRKPVLVTAALVAAIGLCGMAMARDWWTAAFALIAYMAGSATFLALHGTFAMQLLPDPRHRGRDLGLLNLTNTLPAMIGPALAWALARPDDFGPLMLVLALLTACGGVVIGRVEGRR